MFVPYNNPIKIKTASLGDTEEKSITIHDYYDINLGYDYSCNGNIIGDQFKTFGPINIPAYNRVTKVKINFSWDSVDDEAVVKIGDLRIETTGAWNHPGNISDTYNIKLNSSTVYIEAGAVNYYESSCNLINGKLSVTFLYN